MNRSTSPRLVALGALALAFATSAAPARGEEEEKVLNVYNWADYIAPDMIAKFEKETGIKVRYDNFDTNEILHAKMVAGRSGYDVVVPSSYFGRMQLMGGLLRPIDRSLIPNWKHLDPAILEALARIDPGNKYLVDWAWGYTTIGINVDKVKKALGDLPMPENAWDLVFKPEYMKRLHSCGVSFLDSATDVVPPAARYMGKPSYSRNPADYNGVLDMLRAVRPYVSLFSSSGYINDLANGSICVSMGFSGDLNMARKRAIEGKTGQNIQCLVPKSGGMLFFDTMAIPVDAPHPGNAHKWIDFYLRPDVSAGLTNKAYYANPNKDSKPFLDPEVAGNKTVFPGDEEMKKMDVPGELTNDSRRAMTRIFTSFKTGL